MRDTDKFRGCLVGGAAGDALGYEGTAQWVHKYEERDYIAWRSQGENYAAKQPCQD